MNGPLPTTVRMLRADLDAMDSELQQLRRETKRLRDDRDRLADIIAKDVARKALVDVMDSFSHYGNGDTQTLLDRLQAAKKVLADSEPGK
jgi:hypothetical protein